MTSVPVLLKTGSELEWPGDRRIFYVLGREGLMICRNHEFFRSCVPARGGPSELHAQEEFLELAFPRIPQRAFEHVVGFFAAIGALHGSEAAVLLYWDRERERVRIVAPGTDGDGRALRGRLPAPDRAALLPCARRARALDALRRRAQPRAPLRLLLGHRQARRVAQRRPAHRGRRHPQGAPGDPRRGGRRRRALRPDAGGRDRGLRAPRVPRSWIDRVKIEADSPWSWGKAASDGGSS